MRQQSERLEMAEGLGKGKPIDWVMEKSLNTDEQSYEETFNS